MSFLGFGDNSDYKVVPKQGKKGNWYWIIEDEKGKARSVGALFGSRRFQTREAVLDDAREVVKGLGADFKDLEIAS